ncbi:hypothetical protein KAJ27_00020 [bacterium]|nr:hypothetical protein [bacterium]
MIQIKIFEALEKYELAISKLYKTYSDLCPEFSNFWSHLSEDEEVHASWVRSLGVLAKNGILRFDSSRFNIKPIETSIEYVNDVRIKAPERKPDIILFLSIALDLENSIIEKNFYKVVSNDEPDMAKIFMDLSNGAEHHSEAVQNLRTKILIDRKK